MGETAGETAGDSRGEAIRETPGQTGTAGDNEGMASDAVNHYITKNLVSNLKI